MNGLRRVDDCGHDASSLRRLTTTASRHRRPSKPPSSHARSVLQTVHRSPTRVRWYRTSRLRSRCSRRTFAASVASRCFSPILWSSFTRSVSTKAGSRKSSSERCASWHLVLGHRRHAFGRDHNSRTNRYWPMSTQQQGACSASRAMAKPSLMSNVNAHMLPATPYAEQLAELVGSCAWLMQALRAVRTLGLDSWCIGAGAVRSLVWNHLHGFDVSPSGADVDVVFFDSSRRASRAGRSVSDDRATQSNACVCSGVR